MSESKAKPRRAPPTMAQRMNIMLAIKEADIGMPDVNLARQLSHDFGIEINSGMVGNYRVQLGLASVKAMSRAQMAEELAKAQAEIQRLKSPPLISHAEVIGELNKIIDQPLFFKRSNTNKGDPHAPAEPNQFDAQETKPAGNADVITGGLAGHLGNAPVAYLGVGA